MSDFQKMWIFLRIFNDFSSKKNRNFEVKFDTKIIDKSCKNNFVVKNYIFFEKYSDSTQKTFLPLVTKLIFEGASAILIFEF